MTRDQIDALVRKKKTEAQIQAECCNMLDAMQIEHSPTDASRTFGKDGKPRRSKVKKGWPDLTGIFGFTGRFLGVEVKRPGEKQTAEQIACQKRIERRGGLYLLVYSAEELKRKLEGRG